MADQEPVKKTAEAAVESAKLEPSSIADTLKLTHTLRPSEVPESFVPSSSSSSTKVEATGAAASIEPNLAAINPAEIQPSPSAFPPEHQPKMIGLDAPAASTSATAPSASADVHDMVRSASAPAKTTLGLGLSVAPPPPPPPTAAAAAAVAADAVPAVSVCTNEHQMRDALRGASPALTQANNATHRVYATEEFVRAVMGGENTQLHAPFGNLLSFKRDGSMWIVYQTPFANPKEPGSFIIAFISTTGDNGRRIKAAVLSRGHVTLGAISGSNSCLPQAFGSVTPRLTFDSAWYSPLKDKVITLAPPQLSAPPMSSAVTAAHSGSSTAPNAVQAAHSRQKAAAAAKRAAAEEEAAAAAAAASSAAAAAPKQADRTPAKKKSKKKSAPKAHVSEAVNAQQSHVLGVSAQASRVTSPAAPPLVAPGSSASATALPPSVTVHFPAVSELPNNTTATLHVEIVRK